MILRSTNEHKLSQPVTNGEPCAKLVSHAKFRLSIVGALFVHTSCVWEGCAVCVYVYNTTSLLLRWHLINCPQHCTMPTLCRHLTNWLLTGDLHIYVYNGLKMISCPTHSTHLSLSSMTAPKMNHFVSVLFTFSFACPWAQNRFNHNIIIAAIPPLRIVHP